MNNEEQPIQPKRRPARKKKAPTKPAKPATPRKPRKKKPAVDPYRNFYIAAFVILAALAIGQPIYRAFFEPNRPSPVVPVDPDNPVGPIDPVPDPVPLVNPFRDLSDKAPGWVSEYIQTPKVAEYVGAMREALGEVLANYDGYASQSAIFSDIEAKVRSKVGDVAWVELGWFMLKIREAFSEGRKSGLLDSTPASAKAFFEAWKKGVDNA